MVNVVRNGKVVAVENNKPMELVGNGFAYQFRERNSCDTEIIDMLTGECWEIQGNVKDFFEMVNAIGQERFIAMCKVISCHN